MIIIDMVIETFNNTLDNIMMFSLFGIIVNFVFIIISSIITILKVNAMSQEQLYEMIVFSTIRSKHINTSTTQLRRFLHMMLVFIPTYSVYISVVFLYYLLTTKNSNPVIKASIMADNASIFPIANFKSVIVKISEVPDK